MVCAFVRCASGELGVEAMLSAQEKLAMLFSRLAAVCKALGRCGRGACA